MATRNATRKTTGQSDTSPQDGGDTSRPGDTDTSQQGDITATSGVGPGDNKSDNAQVGGSGDVASRDAEQDQDDDQDDAPEGYERGYGAFAGRGLVATATSVEQLMAEAAAAGHARPSVIVPVFRPAPEQGDQ